MARAARIALASGRCAVGQLAVKARRQASRQHPVPGPQPPNSQAAEVVVKQDMHRMPPPTS